MPKIVEDEHIFWAVIHTIIERGYEGATTRQMADAAGVSEVTLFRKYGNKMQLVQRAIGAIIEQTNVVEATQYTGSIREDLLAVLQAYQASVVVHGQFFAIIFIELTRHPELLQSFEQPLGLFTAISHLITYYQNEGLLRKEHPMQAVAALLGPLIYHMMWHQMVIDASIPPINLPQYVQLFLEGHGASANSFIINPPV